MTPFESQPANLVNFLKTVSPQGGMGNEAIELAYNNINKTQGIDQVIIIGDAPANTDSETIQKRSSCQG